MKMSIAIFLWTVLFLVACNKTPTEFILEKGWLESDPPKLLNAEASGRQLVILTFDEPLDMETTSTKANYFIEPSLEILSIQVGTEGQTLYLQTEEQVAAQSYLVYVQNITDRIGNKIAAPYDRTYFVGFGQIPDPTPPDILSPLSGSPIFSDSVDISWTPRTEASAYMIEIASNSTFSNLLFDSPYIVGGDVTSIRIDVQESITYWCRIRADITTPGAYGSVHYEGMDDTLYVFCPSDVDTCSDAKKIGNRSKPFQTITGALSFAAIHSISQVYVAERGDNHTYQEKISLLSGINLYGGYSSSFNEAEYDPEAHPAIVRHNGSSIVEAIGITQPTVLSGFTFLGDIYTNTGMVINGCNDQLLIEDCSIRILGEAQKSKIGMLIVDSLSQTTSGPIIRGNTIYSGDIKGYDDTVGLECYNSAPLIDRNFIQTGYGDQNSSCYGVRFYDSEPELFNNVIIAGEIRDMGKNYGLTLENSDATVINNTIVTKPVHPARGSYAVNNNWGSQPLFINNIIVIETTVGSPLVCFREGATGADPKYLEHNFFMGDVTLYMYADAGVGYISDGDNGGVTTDGNLFPEMNTLSASGTISSNNYTLLPSNSISDIFVDPTNLDYHLKAGCRAKHAGKYYSLTPEIDLDGTVRSDPPSIGAFE